jgi:hypothetical protein
MKKYLVGSLVGLCFIISSLSHAAAEPDKGPCYKLAERLALEGPDKDLCFPCTGRLSDGFGELVIVTSKRNRYTDWFITKPCGEWSPFLMWRASRNLNHATTKAGRRVEQLKQCLEEHPEEKQDSRVRYNLNRLNENSKYLSEKASDLEKCKAGDTSPLGIPAGY